MDTGGIRGIYMRTLMKAFNKFILVSYDLIRNVAGAVLVAIILIVTSGIISRYVFGKALSWTEEVCCLLLIWMCYLSASLTTVKKEHVVADFVSSSLPEGAQKLLRTIIRFGELIFFAVIAYSCMLLIPRLTNFSAALEIPRYVYYLPVLIGSLYMSFAVLVDIMNDFIPGYDYFGQRRLLQQKEADEAQNRENEKLQKSVDDFLDFRKREEKT